MRCKIHSASNVDGLLEDNYLEKLHERGVPVGIVQDKYGNATSVINIIHLQDLMAILDAFEKVVINVKTDWLPEIMIYDYFIE